ncbi:MAG: ATP-binding cassette domain-containing protein [Candidatus Coproplasma sp.]
MTAKPKMEQPIFVSTNITKKFGQTIALNNVDISIYPGEIRGFIGENGSGKSTMGALMTGIHDVTSGSMFYHGKEWNPGSMIEALNGGIGIIVQENGTIPQISVAENIYLGELSNFSGVHFFEDRKVENFSPVFDGGVLKEFDESAERMQRSVDALLADGENAWYECKRQIKLIKKDKILSAEQKSGRISELKDRASRAAEVRKTNAAELKRLRAEYKAELKTAYLAAQEKLREDSAAKLRARVEEYNQKSLAYFQAFNAKLASNEDKYAEIYKGATDLALEKRRHDNDVKEIKKEYADQIRALDAKHELFCNWMKDDVHSLTNHYKNCISDLTAKNGDSLSLKVRRAVLTVVFGLFVNRKKLNKHAQHALNKIGVNHIYAAAPCAAYDMQDRKLIEIAKCLNKSPEIFIVDETTTALSETGRNILYKQMEELKAQGRSVLFVSHDLDEIMEKCDTLTVLRDGNIVTNLDKAKGEFDPDVIRKAMIGRELKGDYYRADYDVNYGEEVVLKMVDGIEGKQLRHINLELHKGEILGVGGLSECGMHTLGKALFGNIKMEGGYVYTGKDLEKLVTNEVVAMNNHIGYLPKNRDTEGLAQNDSIFSNIAIASINKIAKLKTFVFKGSEKKIVNKEVHDLSIKCNSSSDLISSLSGGNKQKVSLAKWIGNDSEILILDCPTRGVDIGVKQFIYQLMCKMKKDGKSIIMISEELPELIGMSDRILIMKDGVIAKEFLRSKDLTQEQIVQYMI